MGDLDVCFRENPDLRLAQLSPSVLLKASPERYSRRYWGINSHLMVLKPSRDLFWALLSRAKRGEYIPYTNGEQDVLESVFPTHLFATESMHKFISHHHWWSLMVTPECSWAKLYELNISNCT